MTSESRDQFRRGILLFNRESFFDAHEVWEDVWREAAGPQKKFLQGLIQVAVAFHHHSTGNIVGARSLMSRATRNLSEHTDPFQEIGVRTLIDSLAEWQLAMDDGHIRPPMPKLREIA